MTLWREFRAGGGSTLMLSLAGTLLLAGALWFAIQPSSLQAVPGWGLPSGLLLGLALLAGASLLLLVSFLGRGATVVTLLAAMLAALFLLLHPQLRPFLPFDPPAAVPVAFDAVLRPLAAAGVLAFLAAWRLRAPAASPLAALPLALLALLLLRAIPQGAVSETLLKGGPLPLLFLWSSLLLALLPWRGATLTLLPLAGLAVLASPLAAALGVPFLPADSLFAFALPESWPLRLVLFAVTLGSFLARFLARRWQSAQKPT